jgi:hypothetical protein
LGKRKAIFLATLHGILGQRGKLDNIKWPLDSDKESIYRNALKGSTSLKLFLTSQYAQPVEERLRRSFGDMTIEFINRVESDSHLTSTEQWLIVPVSHVLIGNLPSELSSFKKMMLADRFSNLLPLDSKGKILRLAYRTSRLLLQPILILCLTILAPISFLRSTRD